jgi:hypothetical protein
LLATTRPQVPKSAAQWWTRSKGTRTGFSGLPSWIVVGAGLVQGLRVPGGSNVDGAAFVSDYGRLLEALPQIAAAFAAYRDELWATQ